MRASRALALPGVGSALKETVRTLPEPGPGEALVRIEACGVCGSDLFLQEGGFGKDKFPIVPGHEASGRVEAVGGPEDSSLVGRQVAMYYIDAPQNSHWGDTGRINIGPDVVRMGVDVDGAFAEYVVRPVYTLIPVEPELPPVVVAVSTDALATPYHALTAIARLQPGERLVVIGPGGVGSNAVQIGSMMGAEVIAVGRSEAKLDQARRLGAHVTLSSAEGVSAVVQAAGGNVDVVLECSGATSMARFAVDCAGFGGRVVMVGASRQPFNIATGELIWRELSVLGSRGFTPGEIQAVLQHVRDGHLRTDHLTRQQRPWREANEALGDLRDGQVLRTVLVMDGS